MGKTITVDEILSRFGVATTPGTFGLTAVRDENQSPKVNQLTWTYPENLEFALISGGLDFNRISIQRSTSASNTPNPPLVAYSTLLTFPVPDANWIDIKFWTRGPWDAAGHPTTYNDNWDAALPVAYRMILNCANGASNRIQMDWNRVLIVPSQQFYIGNQDGTPNDSASPRYLHWTVPSVSWWGQA